MEKKMSETVTGYIDHVIFRNEDNGYTVMVLKGMEEEQELTCVGTFPAITQGAAIEASGNYTTHPVYGKQFQISSYVEKMPEDALAMERYLGSGAIKGIGAALAARIVRRFGDDTMRIVEEEPERLAEIKGISEKKAMEIAEQMTEKADMRRAMIFLQKYGISLNLGAKIYQKYGQTVYARAYDEYMESCRRIRIALQRISVVWDSVSQMRSLPGSGSIQIQITG